MCVWLSYRWDDQAWIPAVSSVHWAHDTNSEYHSARDSLESQNSVAETVDLAHKATSGCNCWRWKSPSAVSNHQSPAAKTSTCSDSHLISVDESTRRWRAATFPRCCCPSTEPLDGANGTRLDTNSGYLYLEPTRWCKFLDQRQFGSEKLGIYTGVKINILSRNYQEFDNSDFAFLTWLIWHW